MSFDINSIIKTQLGAFKKVVFFLALIFSVIGVCFVCLGFLNPAHAEKTNEEVFSEAKQWGRDRSGMAKGYIQHNDIRTTVPYFPASSAWQEDLYQNGFGNTRASGAVFADDCRVDPNRPDQKDTQQCNALNLLQHAANTSNPYTITDSDPLITINRPIVTNPASSGVGNIPSLGGQYSACTTETVTTPEEKKKFTCELFAKVDTNSCTVGNVVHFNEHTTYQCDQTVKTRTNKTCERVLTIEMRSCVPPYPSEGAHQNVPKKNLATIKDYISNSIANAGLVTNHDETRVRFDHRFCAAWFVGVRVNEGNVVGEGGTTNLHKYSCLSVVDSGSEATENGFLASKPAAWDTNSTFEVKANAGGTCSGCRVLPVTNVAQIKITAAAGSQLYLVLRQAKGLGLNPANSEPLIELSSSRTAYNYGTQWAMANIKQPRCTKDEGKIFGGNTRIVCTEWAVHDTKGLFIADSADGLWAYAGNYNLSTWRGYACSPNAGINCSSGSTTYTERDRPFLSDPPVNKLFNLTIPLSSGENLINLRFISDKRYGATLTFQLTGRCANDVWTGCATLEGSQ